MMMDAQNAGEADWMALLALIAADGASLEASAAVEDFIDRHADDFVERIEEQTAISRAFAELVATAHLGDMSGEGVERIARLQDHLFARRDLGLVRWKGWVPLSSDFPRDQD